MREAKKELGVHEPVYGEGGAVCVCVDGRKAFERLMGTDDEPSQYRRLCTPSLAKCQQYPNGVSTWATTFDGVKVARRTHTSPLVARNAACRLLTNSTRPLLVLALPNVNDKKTSELKWLYSPTVSFLEWLDLTSLMAVLESVTLTDCMASRPLGVSFDFGISLALIPVSALLILLLSLLNALTTPAAAKH